MKHMSFPAIFAAALLCVSVQAQAQSNWKLATGYGAGTFHTQNIQQFATDVNRATGGQFRIEVHPGNSLVKLADIRQAVQEGKVEAGETIMSSMVQEIPIAGADSIPFVVGTFEDAGRMWKLQRPLMEKHFAARGLTLLFSVPWPPQGLFTTRPVRKPADLAGSRMRTYNQATVRIAELLQAQPVDVPTAEVGKALQQGRIDAMITSASTGAAGRVWGTIKHYYEINAWFPKNVVFVNTKAFQALPGAVQKSVRMAAEEAERRGWAMSQQEMLDATQVLRDNGIKVDRSPAEFDTEIKRLGEKFSREWVRSVGNEANQIFVPYYTQ